MTIDELSGSLLAHEERLKRTQKELVEQALQTKTTITDEKVLYSQSFQGRGSRGRGGHGNGRGGRGRGQGEYYEEKGQSKIQVKDQGTISYLQKNALKRLIENVYYVSDLKSNILSMGQLMEKGYSIFMKN
jgi:hypothetical protein